MSKKLIAIASAAALALAGLVGIAPANSATGPFAVTTANAFSTQTTARDGSTSTKAIKINVPSTDTIRSVANTGTTETGDSTAVYFDVTTPGSTDVVTVTSTGGIKLLTKTQFDSSTAPKTATGTQSLTITAASGDAEFYAYTTSTTAGTVVVSAAGSSQTFHVQGVSFSPYKVAFTAPSSAALGAKFKVVGTVKDAFGNDLTTALTVSDVTTDFTLNTVGATAPTVATYDATAKTYTFEYTAPATATGTALQISIKDTKQSTKVTAFGDPVNSAFFTVNAVDLSTQVTALTAQVAALQAQLEASRPKATSVTKKRFNTLARKWNAANPGSRVALKK
jgi:hypothetical protein